MNKHEGRYLTLLLYHAIGTVKYVRGCAIIDVPEDKAREFDKFNILPDKLYSSAECRKIIVSALPTTYKGGWSGPSSATLTHQKVCDIINDTIGVTPC